MMKRRGSVHFSSTTFHSEAHGPGRRTRSDTIEGEYTVVEPDEPSAKPDDLKPTPTLEDRKNTP